MGRIRNACWLSLAALLLALPAGCPSSGTLNDDTSSSTTDTTDPAAETRDPLPEVDADDHQLRLLTRAENIVEKVYPEAVLVEARGTPAGKKASTADDIVNWQFLFMENPLAPGAATIVLEYTDGEFGDRQLLSQGLVGTMYERVPRTMTLTTAVQFLRDAGHAGSFSQVTLRKPLTFPVPEEAYYIFTIGDDSVLVGMATGEVSTE